MSSTSKNGTCDTCDLRAFERNRYFDGKLLTTRDFQDEQAYLRGKDRLHNSLLHGVGTVCGLKITEHPNPACRHRYVVLNPGLALDCCGHEIVVPEEEIVDLRKEIEKALREAGRFPASGEPDPTNVYVRLAYAECDTEEVPALLDDCGCTDANTEHNRTREGYHLFVDLEDPLGEAADPLDARLDWQHTLSTALPEAIVVDHQLERLYVAEWDGESGWLRMYDAANHSLVVPPVPLGERSARPTAAARSNLGDLIYVAVHRPGARNSEILIFDQNRLETLPGTALRAELSVKNSQVVQLGVSPLDDSLFVLTEKGHILHWSSNSIRDWVADSSGSQPDPIDQNVRVADPQSMTISYDGRWMVVADGAAPRLVVVNLAQFDAGGGLSNLLAEHRLPPGHTPSVVAFSFDGKILYVLCSESQMLYRIEVRDSLDSFIPDIPAEGDAFSAVRLADPATPNVPQPLDIGISPRDNWLYVLRRLFDDDGHLRDRGEVLILSVDAMNERHGPDTYNLEDTPELGGETADVEGIAQFQDLAFLGQRLYVAGRTPGEADRGSVSILYVDEAACDAFIQRTIEGCATCESASTGVILASIANYEWDEAMVEDESAGPNLIDNLTYRPLVPSTNTLRQVIECMLDKGISEGIPGPRGPVGPKGEKGDTGDRGPGIAEATATTRAPGQPATASLQPIPGDPQGDQRLLLGIPRGADGTDGADGADGTDGAPGPRGPGITDVDANTLPAGSEATATLQAIPGDPQGDQRLILGIPRGADGESPQPPDLNRVINASWHHDEIMSFNDFMQRFATDDGSGEPLGMVIEFERRVKPETLHSRSVYLLALRLNGAFECDCILPMRVEPVRVTRTVDTAVEWWVGDTLTSETFNLVSQATPAPASPRAVRLVPEDGDWAKLDSLLRESEVQRLTVVLRGDWIIGPGEEALDGNHVWPGVPGRKSGNGAQGGDWISMIHIHQAG